MQRIPKVVLLIETSRQYGRSLLRGISKYVRLHGPWTVYRTPGGLPAKPPKLRNWRPDGIIMRGEPVKPEEIMEMGWAAVFAPRGVERIPGVPSITVDSVATGAMGAEHLRERGFKHFAFCGFLDRPWSRKRREGFCQRVAEAGFAAQTYETPEALSARRWSQEHESIAQWLKSLPKPVGILACTDYRGQHVIEGSRLAGLHVPEEVAVLGICNDDIICSLCDPPLSSIVLTGERAGYEAAQILDKMMSGQKVDPDTVITVDPVYVVTRQSTDIMAIQDPEVATAIRFIRQNSRNSLQVSDVVAATSVSRRALELRFERAIGSSIYRQIRRTRVELITKALVETNRTISQIAVDLGYSGTDHFARYFRAEKGMSPAAFRRRHWE